MYKRTREVVRGEVQLKLGPRVDARFPINRLSGVADGALHEPRLNFQRDRGGTSGEHSGSCIIHIPSHDIGR